MNKGKLCVAAILALIDAMPTLLAEMMPRHPQYDSESSSLKQQRQTSFKSSLLSCYFDHEYGAKMPTFITCMVT